MPARYVAVPGVGLVDQGPKFDSVSTCSAQTGIPASILKQAKRSGCIGFDDHSRIVLYPVLKWIFNDNEKGELMDWRNHYEKFSALIVERKFEELDKKLINREVVKNVSVQAMSSMFLILRKVYGEMPPSLKGRSEVEICKKLEEACDEIEQKVRDAFEKLKE